MFKPSTCPGNRDQYNTLQFACLLWRANTILLALFASPVLNRLPRILSLAAARGAGTPAHPTFGGSGPSRKA